MGSSTIEIRGHVPVPWLFSLLNMLMLMTLDVDAPSINQPRMIQCPMYEYTYCNNTYQFCHLHLPKCLNCIGICYQLHEHPHHCKTQCPIYYHNAIEAAAKLAESTTQVTTVTTEQTDLGPTSPGSTEDISEMGPGKIVAVCLLAVCTVVVVVLVGYIYMQYRKAISRQTQTSGFMAYFCQKCRKWKNGAALNRPLDHNEPDHQNELPVETEPLEPNGQANRNTTDGQGPLIVQFGSSGHPPLGSQSSEPQQ